MSDESGSTTAITEDGALEDGRFSFEEIWSTALSPDGTQAAVWGGSGCVEWGEGPPPTGGRVCELDQKVLVLIDIASGATSTIGATQNDPGGHLVFSPDGSKLVYDAEGGLYVTAIP